MYMGSQFDDETHNHIEELTMTHTQLVKDSIRAMVQKTSSQADVSLKKLITRLATRGIFTMLGLRKTFGSQDIAWPSPAKLLEGFNKPNQIISVEEAKRLKHVSKLTVGSRGLLKHCHRSSDGFWGNNTGSEL